MSDMSSRQAPNRPPATLSDLELIVRPPGDPARIQAFTGAERADAELYAAETNAMVEQLGCTGPPSN